MRWIIWDCLLLPLLPLALLAKLALLPLETN